MTCDRVAIIDGEALRSLILEDLAWAKIGAGFAVVGVLGALMLMLNVRLIRQYD